MIRTAKAEENEELSSLAVRSKAHWNYDADFLEACRQDLTYTQQDISHHTVYVVEEMGQVVGFYRLEIRENELELSDLFIEPSKIGQGYGKMLWDHAICGIILFVKRFRSNWRSTFRGDSGAHYPLIRICT